MRMGKEHTPYIALIDEGQTTWGRHEPTLKTMDVYVRRVEIQKLETTIHDINPPGMPELVLLYNPKVDSIRRILSYNEHLTTASVVPSLVREQTLRASGATYCMVRPNAKEFRETVERALLLGKRKVHEKAEGGVVMANGYVVDMNTGIARYGDKKVFLAPMELHLIDLIHKNPNTRVRDLLPKSRVNSKMNNLIKLYIHNIRGKLGSDAILRGKNDDKVLGYTLNPNDQE